MFISAYLKNEIILRCDDKIARMTEIVITISYKKTLKVVKSLGKLVKWITLMQMV